MNRAQNSDGNCIHQTTKHCFTFCWIHNSIHHREKIRGHAYFRFYHITAHCLMFKICWLVTRLLFMPVPCEIQCKTELIRACKLCDYNCGLSFVALPKIAPWSYQTGKAPHLSQEFVVCVHGGVCNCAVLFILSMLGPTEICGVLLNTWRVGGSYMWLCLSFRFVCTIPAIFFEP